mmetsp:Transcript_86943/g.246166  ORF Transcript_86943/g.246166 Transcript_86943/m.246166 type:complete len:272 (-) Transcript_86943:456-1271(-)
MKMSLMSACLSAMLRVLAALITSSSHASNASAVPKWVHCVHNAISQSHCGEKFDETVSITSCSSSTSSTSSSSGSGSCFSGGVYLYLSVPAVSRNMLFAKVPASKRTSPSDISFVSTASPHMRERRSGAMLWQRRNRGYPTISGPKISDLSVHRNELESSERAKTSLSVKRFFLDIRSATCFCTRTAVSALMLCSLRNWRSSRSLPADSSFLSLICIIVVERAPTSELTKSMPNSSVKILNSRSSVLKGDTPSNPPANSCAMEKWKAVKYW